MKSIDNIYTLDGKVPLVKALPFGFQHILTMFVSNITPIMIMAGKCGFSQRNILIISLSMSIGIGFAQVPELFAIFPDLVKSTFGENCVVLVFLISAFLNIVLPKDMDFEGKK